MTRSEAPKPLDSRHHSFLCTRPNYLLAELENPFPVMVLLNVTTGLRRSELFALQWKDIDFSNPLIDIKRPISRFTLEVYAQAKNESQARSATAYR